MVVLADLDSNENPLLTARAASMLPATSRVAVHHGGRAIDDDVLLDASAEASSNPRYIWHGALNANAALELLASAHVIACTSVADGPIAARAGIALGVPVICTRVSAHLDLFGDDHPGLFAAGDHLAVSTMLDWLEISPVAVTDLARRSSERQHLITPASVRASFSD